MARVLSINQYLLVFSKCQLNNICSCTQMLVRGAGVAGQAPRRLLTEGASFVQIKVPREEGPINISKVVLVYSTLLCRP